MWFSSFPTSVYLNGSLSSLLFEHRGHDFRSGLDYFQGHSVSTLSPTVHVTAAVYLNLGQPQSYAGKSLTFEANKISFKSNCLPCSMSMEIPEIKAHLQNGLLWNRCFLLTQSLLFHRFIPILFLDEKDCVAGLSTPQSCTSFDQKNCTLLFMCDWSLSLIHI